MDKPSLPKGTRDFGPIQMAKRQHILNTIRKVFETYGFQPLETPAMENLSTLTGKYGDEGDQLLFRILDSGNFLRELGIDAISKLPQKTDSLRTLFDEVQSDLIQSRQELSKSNLHTLLETRLSQHPELKPFVSDNFALTLFLIHYWISNNHNPGSDDAKNRLIQTYQVRNELVNSVSSALKWSAYNSKINTGEYKEFVDMFTEKGLRYDLTVPFARYVVMNRHEIVLPFKRYQIQPVWRADRPQKGRYREFYQCDADVVGTDSLVCEAEIILMIKEVFSGLKISDYTIKINHRGILTGLSQLSGSIDNENALFVSIDKLDKSDEKSVREELSSKGFSQKGIDQLFQILNFHGSGEQKIKHLDEAFASLPGGKKSVSELRNVFELLGHFGAGQDHVEFDLSLARGLSYYTGCIFEVKVNNVSIGSVTGGGRYDNLTQAFGSKEKLSGVGISFGIDRLYDVMEELNLFPDEALTSSTVLVCHLDEASQQAGFKTVYQLRKSGVAAEIYPDLSKLKKQLEYADKKKIPFTIVIGEDEVKSGVLTIKNMKTGEQEKLTLEQVLKKL